MSGVRWLTLTTREARSFGVALSWSASAFLPLSSRIVRNCALSSIPLADKVKHSDAVRLFVLIKRVIARLHELLQTLEMRKVSGQGAHIFAVFVRAHHFGCGFCSGRRSSRTQSGRESMFSSEIFCRGRGQGKEATSRTFPCIGWEAWRANEKRLMRR